MKYSYLPYPQRELKTERESWQLGLGFREGAPAATRCNS